MDPKSLLVLLILLAQIFKLVLSELTLSTHCLGETCSVSKSLVADAPSQRHQMFKLPVQIE